MIGNWTKKLIASFKQVTYQDSTDPGNKQAIGVVGFVSLIDALGNPSSLGGGAGGSNDTHTTASGQITAIANVGGKTITLNSLSFPLTAEMVIGGSIKKITSTGVVTSVPLTTVTVSGNVITLADADDFVSGDEVSVVLIATEKKYDVNEDIEKVVDQSPLWNRYTDAESLVSATPYELTASFADVCPEVDVRGYNYTTLWFTVDIGTSVNPQIRILHKHESGGTEEYREIYLGSPASNVTTINLNDYEIATDADQLFKITIPVTGSRYIQIQAKDDANGDGQLDKLYITKDWGA